MSSWYYLEKEFYDSTDDVEGVNIHYVWTPLGSMPDWEEQRITRFMPLVQSPAYLTASAWGDAPASGVMAQSVGRLRKKVLKLPHHIREPESNTLTDHYHLHYYFEVFQSGHRHYSSLFTEVIMTGAGTAPSSPPPVDQVGTHPH